MMYEDVLWDDHMAHGVGFMNGWIDGWIEKGSVCGMVQGHVGITLETHLILITNNSLINGITLPSRAAVSKTRRLSIIDRVSCAYPSVVIPARVCVYRLGANRRNRRLCKTEITPSSPQQVHLHAMLCYS